MKKSTSNVLKWVIVPGAIILVSIVSFLFRESSDDDSQRRSPGEVTLFSTSFPGINLRYIDNNIPNNGSGIYIGPYWGIGSKGQDGIFVVVQLYMDIYDDSDQTTSTTGEQIKTCSSLSDVEGISDDMNHLDKYIYFLDEGPDEISLYDYQACSKFKYWSINDTSLEGLTFVPDGFHPYGSSQYGAGGVFYLGNQWNSGEIHVVDVGPDRATSATNIASLDDFNTAQTSQKPGMEFLQELGLFLISYAEDSGEDGNTLCFYQINQQYVIDTESELGRTTYIQGFAPHGNDNEGVGLRMGASGAANTAPTAATVPTDTLVFYVVSDSSGSLDLRSYDFPLNSASVGALQYCADFGKATVSAKGSRWIHIQPYMGQADISFKFRAVDHLDRAHCPTYWMKTDYTLTVDWTARGVQLPSAWISGATHTDGNSFYFSSQDIVPDTEYRLHVENEYGGNGAGFSQFRMFDFLDANGDGVVNQTDEDCIVSGTGSFCTLFARDQLGAVADECGNPDGIITAADTDASENSYTFTGGSPSPACEGDPFDWSGDSEIASDGIDNDCDGSVDE